MVFREFLPCPSPLWLKGIWGCKSSVVPNIELFLPGRKILPADCEVTCTISQHFDPRGVNDADVTAEAFLGLGLDLTLLLLLLSLLLLMISLNMGIFWSSENCASLGSIWTLMATKTYKGMRPLKTFMLLPHSYLVQTLFLSSLLRNNFNLVSLSLVHLMNNNNTPHDLRTIIIKF